MRHRRTTAKLNRNPDHRKAMLRNLATSLALHGHVKTTTAKAKALVSYFEKLVTSAKGASEMNAVRLVKRHLYTEPAQKAFLKRTQNVERSSGYLRTTKVGFRPGDRSEMTLVEFA